MSYLSALLAIALLPFSLAAFASLNPSAPVVFWGLELAEHMLSQTLGIVALGAFTRGLCYGMLAVVLMSLAAWIKPRQPQK